ncbi:MAG: sugar nucleotide-binding protein [Clostridia bacterium]|nr:sugar nucleotide-binding protein [Clostridia bacterium]
MLCIVGADGFLGTYLQKHIFSSGINTPLLALNHRETAFPLIQGKTDMTFELKDSDSVKRVAEKLSEYDDIRILFLASVHAPDIVKKDPESAEYINTVCYGNFLDEIKGLDIKKLIYSSSDTVYGESIDGYSFTEKDETCPINIYGKQKLLAEKITLSHGFSVARYSYMCGKALSDRKKHFYDEISEKLTHGEKVYMLTDWVRSSLSYETAAELTLSLLLSDTGHRIVNICSDTPTSKYDMGLKIAERVSVDKSLVIPVTKKELDIFTEHRAEDIITDNSLLKSILGIENITIGL